MKQSHPRANALWSIDEEYRLTAAYISGIKVNELMVIHGRNRGGIESRLAKLLGTNWHNGNYTVNFKGNNAAMLAKKLTSEGYRRTSTKYSTVSRIDRPDWVEQLAKSMFRAPADFYTDDGELSSHWADFYRRVHSKDTLVVPHETFKLIPGSSGDRCGFLPAKRTKMYNMTNPQVKELEDQIAELESRLKKLTAPPSPLTINFPTLNAGEQYVGCIISRDGKSYRHTILLPHKYERMTWQSAMDWASSIGGSLPDQIESAMLSATMKDQFEDEWYWTSTQYARNTDYAWMQNFINGYQGNLLKSNKHHARAVRHVYGEIT